LNPKQPPGFIRHIRIPDDQVLRKECIYPQYREGQHELRQKIEDVLARRRRQRLPADQQNHGQHQYRQKHAE
jgi:hypothetical protein